ncbi:MAG: Crp/Fnr family transcriptional regulator [Actinomycetota bacterium]|nr:Crp/Fnr family transcriptional regulator [Actinomycetota bacterium]
MRTWLRPEEAAKLLGSTAIFGNLDFKALEGLAAATRQRTYARGQYLCSQGDPGDQLFVIAEGLVKVVFATEQGDEMVLAALRPPEVFGELAVLDQAPRSASVTAVEPTLVLTLSRPRLLQAMRSSPPLVDAVLARLAGLVRGLTEQAGDLAFLDLGGRLAKLLLRLGQKHGVTRGNAILDLGLTQSDLAAMVGASRPAVNRVLHLFAERGFLEISGQVIVLRDLDGLRRRAGFYDML